MGLKVLEGGNQWQCCESFKTAEGHGIIVWTTHGIGVANDDVIVLDLLFCPFCGTKLPEVKPDGSE
jgi:hypothetical protein